MNTVPVLFLESLFFVFKKGAQSPACDLSGLFGKIASESCAKGYRHFLYLKNGLLRAEQFQDCNRQPFDSANVDRKHLCYTALRISSDTQEYYTDPTSLERVLSVVKGSQVRLILNTPNISKEIEKCVESIRFSDLQVGLAVTGAILSIIRKVVRQSTLVIININICSEVETTQLLVDLLQQKQFHLMSLHENSATAINAILESWWENADQMVGKIVDCEVRLLDFQLSTQFKECTEEEERDAQRAYPFAGYWPKITAKFVLKGPLDRAVYWLSRELEFKTLFVFA